MPQAAGPLGEERDEQAAGAGAEVEDAHGTLRLAAGGQRRLDDRLGIRAGLERRLVEAEGDPPELALAENAAHRLAGGTAGDGGGDPLGLPLPHRPVTVDDQARRRQAEQARDEVAGVEIGGVDAGGAQAAAGVGEERAGGRRANDRRNTAGADAHAAVLRSPSWSASSAAWWVASSASISSSRAPPPSISSGSL